MLRYRKRPPLADEWRAYSRRRKVRHLKRDLCFALPVFVGAFTGFWVLLGGSVPGWQTASSAWAAWTAPAKPDFSGPAFFACVSPDHYDGDAIRCGGSGRSMRLHAIDAPEMPGSCRPGRRCTPGDPYAARDHLASLTRGATVTCRQVDTDHYGRQVVQCYAGDVDLSCAMVEDGYAVERYGSLDC